MASRLWAKLGHLEEVGMMITGRVVFLAVCWLGFWLGSTLVV